MDSKSRIMSNRYVIKRVKALCILVGYLVPQLSKQKAFIERSYNITVFIGPHCLNVESCRKLNNGINNIRESALRLVYKEYNNSFDNLLVKDKSFRIHHQNMQKLTVETFNVILLQNIASEVMKGIFRIVENPCSLRNETQSCNV